MKKWRIGMVSAILVLTLVGSTAALAAGPGGHHGWRAGSTGAAPVTACAWAGTCWRDTGDGVRDTWNGSCADTDGDGVCDTCGWTAPGYLDANGDGICDHYGTGHTGGGHHGGQGHCRW